MSDDRPPLDPEVVLARARVAMANAERAAEVAVNALIADERARRRHEQINLSPEVEARLHAALGPPGSRRSGPRKTAWSVEVDG